MGGGGGTGQREPRELGRPRSDVVGPGELQDPLGDVTQILDRRRRTAGHPDDTCSFEGQAVREVARVLDLDRGCSGDPAEPRQLLGVRARASADDHHEVDVTCRSERVLLPADRDRTDRVHDLELVRAAGHQGRELLELPRWLRALADQRHPLPTRDLRRPLLLFVDDDRVGRETEQPHDLWMLRRPEEDDRVTLVDELPQLALLLDDPGAGPVDDLETALASALHHVRPDAVGPDHDRRPTIHVVERLDRLDAEVLEVANDTLVVDDLAERVGRLAGGGRLLRFVDRLPHAVAEARARGDVEGFDGSHDASDDTCGPFAVSSALGRGDRSGDGDGSFLGVGAAVTGLEEGGDPAHDEIRRGRLCAATGRCSENLGESQWLANANRDPTDRSWEPALRPDPVGARDPDGDDGGAGSQRERGEAILRVLELPGRAAGALREDEEDVTLLEHAARRSERLEVGRSAVDRQDTAVFRDPADDRPIEQLSLAEPVDP